MVFLDDGICGGWSCVGGECIAVIRAQEGPEQT